ncbi:hypothetical protein BN1723_014431, partial [Verticillium longisporum]
MSTDTAAAAVASQAPTAPASEDTAATYESTHVHAVYEAIAPHFSATRHKPWPRVASFLDSLPAGAVGLDIGCGNGKYLAVSPHLHLLGSDRSANLVALARDNTGGSGAPPKKAKGDGPPVEVTTTGPSARRNEVIVADSLTLPYRLSSVDFALSIAVLHHLSTPSRRRAAVRAILDTLVPANGKALLFVWALEQRNSRRGWDASAPQDQLVPWVTKANQPKRDAAVEPAAEEKPDETWHRYYHLYKEGELDADIQVVGGVVLESGYERDNWWAICSRGSEER